MAIIGGKIEPSLNLKPSLEGVGIDGTILELIELFPEGLSLVKGHVDTLWVDHGLSLGGLSLQEQHELKLVLPCPGLDRLLVLILPSSVLRSVSIVSSIDAYHFWRGGIRRKALHEVFNRNSVSSVWTVPKLNDVSIVKANKIFITSEKVLELLRGQIAIIVHIHVSEKFMAVEARMIRQKLLLILEVDAGRDFILQKSDKLRNDLVPFEFQFLDFFHAFLCFFALNRLINGLLGSIIELVAVSSLSKGGLGDFGLKLLFDWAAVFRAKNNAVVLSHFFGLSRNFNELTKFLEGERSVRIVVSPPQDSLDIRGPWMESILLKEIDEVWHGDEQLSATDFIEGFELLVVLALEEGHSNIVSLPRHIFFSFQDSNGHGTDGDGESSRLGVVAGNSLVINDILSEADIGGWEEAVEELVIGQGAVHVGVKLGNDVLALDESGIFHVVLREELEQLLGGDVAISRSVESLEKGSWVEIASLGKLLSHSLDVALLNCDSS